MVYITSANNEAMTLCALRDCLPTQHNKDSKDSTQHLDTLPVRTGAKADSFGCNSNLTKKWLLLNCKSYQDFSVGSENHSHLFEK